MAKRNEDCCSDSDHGRSALRAGDTVMIIAGGNSTKRVLKGKTGKLTRFVGRARDRVIVEGLNMVSRHKRATGMNKPAGKVAIDAPIHVSNVMFYAEKLKRPVRLSAKVLADGKKVRGYRDPKTKEFVQID